jgi:LemA protein
MDFIVQNWLIIAIITMVVIWVVKIYNNLVSYKTQYQNGFEQISVQLKRRLDLIGNLVDAAKKYMDAHFLVITHKYMDGHFLV